MTEQTTRRVIVGYKGETISQASLDTVAELGSVVDVYQSINAACIEVPIQDIGKIKLDANVKYVEYDQVAQILGFPGSEIPTGKKQVLALAQQTPWGISKIRADQVWPSGDKGTSIKGGIIDTGIFYNHPDLAGNYKSGYNFISNTPDPLDDNGHGTHVAGTIAALDNDQGVVGVAPEAYIYSLKVLDANGSGSYSNIISAIQWCIDNKMQVVNMSFGGSSFSQALSDICDKANSAGILLIAAAGNSGGSPGQDTIGYPAKLPSVMAVAATDSNDARASFSSVGVELSVAGPGVSILSTVPTTNVKYGDPSGYKQLSGTSMACPHTVGTAILVLKNNPSLTNVQVRKAIENTAVDLGQPGHDDLYGFGRIDAYSAVNQTPPPIPTLTTITISPATMTINVGGTGQLTATCKDQNNNTMTCPVLTWVSDNTSIATVDSTGKVAGVTQGTANINTSAAGITSNTSTITVSTTPIPVLTTITISPSSYTINIGGTVQLTAVCRDQNGNIMTCPMLTWSSSNTNIANVDANGKVTGVSTGTTNITASAAGITSNVSTITVSTATQSKFDVHTLGSFAIAVLKNPAGQYNADQACATICNILKTM